MRYLVFTALLFVAVGCRASSGERGKLWYEQLCASCHGSPPQERQTGTPNITGLSAARIRFALANVSAMRNVGLSEQQILDVEVYLQRPSEFRAAPGVDYSDLWWNPSESGWGLSLTQHSNSSLVGFLYLYRSDGEPLWLISSQMRWQEPTRISGDLLQTRAAGFPPAGFAPESVQVRKVGTISLQFSSASRGVVEFSIDGVQYRKVIERLAF